MIRFIGIDLAWSERNLSGFAVLEWDPVKRGVGLIDSALVHSDQDIRQAVTRASGDADCLLAIDGPIIAPNEPRTSRACDRAVSRDFGRFHAGTYPANRERARRPIRLREDLERDGYSPDPRLPSSGPCRRQLEIFPHPAHVVLFRRRRIIKYKKGTVDKRRAGLAELVVNLRRYLPSENPPLLDSPLLTDLLETRIDQLRGRAMKGFEDRVDALLCAYMAAYYWQWRDTRCRVYGDVEAGYIICPRLDITPKSSTARRAGGLVKAP